MKGEAMSRKHLWVYVTVSLALLGALVWAGLAMAAPASQPGVRPAAAINVGAAGPVLTFVEFKQDGVGGVDGLAGTVSVTVSPDGNHLYAAGQNDSAVAVFSRNSTTGALSFVEFKKDGVGGVDGLLGVRSVTVSPDGNHLYAAGFSDNAVAVFSRTSTTGALTFVEVQRDGVGGVDGLNRAYSVTVSPDGNHLYVAGFSDNAVAVFSRNSTTGALTFVEFKQDGVGGVDGLDGARSVTVSPDGKHLYAAGKNDDAVAVFSRNSTTGALTFVEFQKDGVGGVDGLNGAGSVTVSPDGNHLYAAGESDDAVAVLSRNSTTGALSFVEVQKDGVGGVDGLNGALSVTVSPDGKHLHAAGFNDDAVVVFSRNSTTGALIFVEVQKDGVSGIDGLDGAISVTVSPDGIHLYAAGHLDDAVAVFSVAPPDSPQSSPFTVTKTGDTSDGFCGTLDCSLREAISSGDSGDTVNIPMGVYTLTQGTELTIGKSLTLNGSGSGDTIIQAATSSGAATSRVLNITGGTVAISGVTVQNGNPPAGSGGGIRNSGTLTLTNSTVSGNSSTSSSSGGIYNSPSGTLTLTDSTISGNTASTHAGGIYNDAGTATLTNTTVSDNTSSSSSGGGIYNRGTGDLTNSTVTSNTATSVGGGIYNSSIGTMTITSSTVSGNTANSRGGGIWNEGTGDLTNSTVSGNTATSSSGGGIYNSSSGTLTLTKSTVSGSTAGNNGGGIWSSGTLTLTNSTVSASTTSGNGSGIYNSSSGTVILTDSAVSGNTAVQGGGGVYNFGGIVTITDSTVSGNTADTSSGAGGIWNDTGTMTLTNSTITGNSAAAGHGGGISNTGTMSIINSTVSGNTAPASVRRGGGIYNNGGTLTITNSTVSGNTAISNGGGVHNNSGTTEMLNTIVAGNTASSGPDCSGSPTSQGHNLIGNNSGCSFTSATDDQVGTAASPIDPKLGPLADNGGPTETHALMAGSPAIDSGDDIVLGAPHNLTSDQRGPGFPRKSGAHVDIGAYEVQPAPADTPQSSPFTVTKTGDTSDGFCGTLDCSLREAISSGDSGDTVNIPMGVYTLALGTELTIGTNLTLNGAGSGDTIVQAHEVPGSGTHRVLKIITGDVTVTGLTIRYGKADSNGGHCGGSSGVPRDPELDVGGGIHNTATLTLSDVVITDNRARCQGAGIYNTGWLTLEDSTVSSNILNGNSAGGGIANVSGTATINRSTISGNAVGGGPTDAGGIRNVSQGTMVITNTTISGNHSIQGHGGGIGNGNSTLTIINSTVANNSAVGVTNAGGIINSSGSVTAFNTVFAGNSPDNCREDAPITSNGHNLSSDGTCSFTATGDFKNVDAKLGPLTDNGGPIFTHALMPGSPAIDSGDDSVLGAPHNLTTEPAGRWIPPQVGRPRGHRGVRSAAGMRPSPRDGEGEMEPGRLGMRPARRPDVRKRTAWRARAHPGVGRQFTELHTELPL